jgi:hypothetical protein
VDSSALDEAGPLAESEEECAELMILFEVTVDLKVENVLLVIVNYGLWMLIYFVKILRYNKTLPS